jgi:hypothetical protein
MKEHSIVIGHSTSSCTSRLAGEIHWEPPISGRIESASADEKEEDRESLSAILRHKINRKCKITPLEAMMLEHGEPSSSSSLSPDQEELHNLVRETTNLLVDSTGHHCCKPKSHREKQQQEQEQQQPKRNMSPFQEEVLEMHESIQSMMSFSVSDLLQEEEERSLTKQGNPQHTTRDQSLEGSIDSILSVSCPRLLEQHGQDCLELKTPKQGAAPTNSKSYSTLTTAALSKSSRDDSQELEDLLLENSLEETSMLNDSEFLVPTRLSSAACFKTPSRSRQRFQTTNNSGRLSVPKNIFSPRGTLVSPLAVDPSPGHAKISMPHELSRQRQMPKTCNVSTIGRSPSKSDKSIVSQSTRVLSHGSEGIVAIPAIGSRCSPSFRSTGTKDRSPMDSFESLDFSPELLGFHDDDDDDADDGNDNDDNVTKDEDVFIVDDISVVHGSSSDSVTAMSCSSSINRFSHFSPIGRPDMATFTWKRNSTCCANCPTMKTRPNKQWSADDVFAKKEVSPRAKAGMARQHRSGDNVLANVLVTSVGQRKFIPAAMEEPPRPPTPIKRRAKLRSKKIQSFFAEGKEVLIEDYDSVSSRQMLLSGMVFRRQDEVESEAYGTANCPDEQQQQPPQPQPQQARHQRNYHRHHRGDKSSQSTSRNRSKSRPRSQSRSRSGTKKPSSQRLSTHDQALP